MVRVMVYRLPLQGAYERLEPYAGKPARTVLRGEWRSNALFLPDKPNGNGAQAAADPSMAAADAAMQDAGTSSPPVDDDIPF